MASDYHRVALVEDGVDPLMARQSMIDAVKLLAEITDYPIWEGGMLEQIEQTKLDFIQVGNVCQGLLRQERSPEAQSQAS